MLKCIVMKRKLYDYLEDSLSEIDNFKVKKHLDTCRSCRERVAQIKTIIDLAGQKNIPQPKEEFWHNFRIELDRRLNDALLSPLTLKSLPRFYRRPALAYAALLVFFLAIAASLYKFPHPAPLQLAQNDDALIEEAIALDELDEAPELNHDEDVYLEEIDLFLALEQA